jgi:hypothetical protein
MREAIPRHRRELGALFAPVGPTSLERLRDLLGHLSRSLEGRA